MAPPAEPGLPEAAGAAGAPLAIGAAPFPISIPAILCPRRPPAAAPFLAPTAELFPAGSGRSVIKPCFSCFSDQPDVERVGGGEAGRHAERHDEPEERLPRLHGPHVAAHHQKAHDRRHRRHHRIHRDEFRDEAAAHVLEIAAAHDGSHEQRLEDEEAEGEAGDILDDQIEPHRQAERDRDDRRENDPGGVAGNAVDRAADALLPQRRDEFLVGSRTRLLVGKHVEEQSDRPHIQSDEDEPPLHHRGLGIAAELIPGNVGRRGQGKRQPGQDEIVDGLNDHGRPRQEDGDLPLFPIGGLIRNQLGSLPPAGRRAAIARSEAGGSAYATGGCERHATMPTPYFPLNAASMADLNWATGCAPTMSCLAMIAPGVPLTPIALPSAPSASIAFW